MLLRSLVYPEKREWHGMLRWGGTNVRTVAEKSRKKNN